MSTQKRPIRITARVRHALALAAAPAFVAGATQSTNPNIQSLALDTTDKICAGTESGVYASSDQCASWIATNTSLPN